MFLLLCSYSLAVPFVPAHGGPIQLSHSFFFLPLFRTHAHFGGSLLHRLAGLRSGGIRILQRFVLATTTYTNKHWGYQRGVFGGLFEARGIFARPPCPLGGFFGAALARGT